MRSFLLLFVVLVLCAACTSPADENAGDDVEGDDDSTDDGVTDDDVSDDDVADDDSVDDDSADDDAVDDDDVDDDSVDDDVVDDDSIDDDAADDDSADDDTIIESIFHSPHDGRIYAAARGAIISPNDENHPCIKYLGGTHQNRVATGVRDDLELRALVLEHDGVHVVLVAMDLVGLFQPDAEAVMDDLEAYGVDRDHVVLASSHTHEAPDTMGIWGRDYFHTGRCLNYVNFLRQTIVDLVVELAGQMTPVTVEAAETSIDDPGAGEPTLSSDARYPQVVNNHVTVARLIDDGGLTVATVVNWCAHPEVLIWASEYTPDFPKWTRLRMEQEFGGVSLYFIGTNGGLMTPLDNSVPERTADGEPVLIGGEQAYIMDNTEVKMWSLGYVIAEYAIAALANAAVMADDLVVRTAAVDIPVKNPMYILGMETGLIPQFNLITDEPWLCGLYGCVRQTLHDIRFDRLHLVTLPGETFSETAVGREETSIDWGEPWGTSVYPAIPGYREVLAGDQLVMDLGLANNEIGYIVPETDYHPAKHPDYYEEQYCISRDAESIVREGVTELLSAH